MSFSRTVVLVLVAALLACLLPAGMAPASAETLGDQTAQDRAALARATAKYEEALTAAAEVDARLQESSAELDRIVAEEASCESRLRTRVVALYRAGEGGALWLILGAGSVQELAARLDLLDRLARQDAADLKTLKAARLHAKESAEELLQLQAEHAQAVDALAAEVTKAQQELAASEAALKEYQARMAAAAAAAAAKRRAAAPATSPDQGLTGSGAWQVGMASHYGRNFTGRGASGEQIGPYSMIVAHKTLPFGTLVEFEYNGKRAVARVADRGPFTPGRDFDLGPGVVRVLDFSGVREVRYRIISQ